MQHAKRLFKRPQARHDSNYYDSAPTRGRLASGESSPSSLGWALTSRSRPPFPPEAAPGVPWAAPGVPSGRSVLTAAAAGACPLVVGAGAPPVPRRPARDDSPLATTLPLVSPAVLPACPLPSYMAMICSAMSSTSACVTLNASNHGPPPECAGRACCVPPCGGCLQRNGCAQAVVDEVPRNLRQIPRALDALDVGQQRSVGMLHGEVKVERLQY